jgi:two-component system sensor histidine kinase RegB
VQRFVYENLIEPDVTVVSDSTLKQTISNVLDNALEASPQWLSLRATRDADTLTLTVTDQGPGFAPAMLAQIGKPYQSTKGQPGRGLGLFLVVNVARTLGGTVTAHNRKEGGAVVQLKLPLASITVEEEKKDVG